MALAIGLLGLLSCHGHDRRLDSISITPQAAVVVVGTSQTLVATGSYWGGSTADLTAVVAWSTTDPAVATVSLGVVSGVATGSTTITALDVRTGISSTAQVVVTTASLVSVQVTPTNPRLALGTSIPLTATGIFDDNTARNLTGALTWSSSDAAVGSVVPGFLQSTGVGTTTITATDVASGISGSTFVTVTPAFLVSLAVTPTAPTIALGTSQRFTATGTFSDATVQDLSTSVSWSSSDSLVATISNAPGVEGLATGTAIGTTTIEALDSGSGIRGATSLGVSGAMLVSLAVTPTAPSIALGTGETFAAVGTFTDASVQDLTLSVMWSSADTGVATVSNAIGSEGSATSVATGMTTITATDAGSGINDSTTLTVTPAVLVSLAVTPTTPSIALGTGQAFVAMGMYTDTSVQDLTSSVTWSSTDTGVATISNAMGSEGSATSVATGTTTIAATDAGSGINDSTTLTVTPAVVVSLAVTPTNPSIALGTGQAFVAMGMYTDASVQDLTSSVTWSSSDTGVATISNAMGSEGSATSVATGMATITATDAGTGINDSTTLTVTPAVLVSLAVTPTNPSIALGTGQAFVVMGTYTDASVQDLTSSVTWSSSDTGVATISNAMGSEGSATSVATGMTTITATDAGSGINDSTTLTVTPAVLVSLAVTPTNPSIALGTGQAFAAMGTYTDASVQDLTSSVTWSSSDMGVATISNAMGSEGSATSVATGTTTITATDAGSGINDSTTLTVTPAALVSLAVTPTNPSIALGTGQAFVAMGTYTDASAQDLTSSVTWSSSDTGVATISNAMGSEGSATSVATGTTTIAATDAGSGINDSTTLTVTPAVLVSLAVTPTNPSIALGTGQAFVAMGTYTDASVQDLTSSVTWSSSGTGVATISNAMGSEGSATSVATGTTTIAATDAGSGINDSTTLTVTPAALVSLAVTPTNPSIALGTGQAFVAMGTYTDASVQDLTSSVTWSSTDTGVATISNAMGSEGSATSVATGTTTIAATDAGSGINDSTTLTVTPAVLVSLAVTPTSPSIALGTGQAFAAMGTYTDASVQDLTSSVTWSSTDAGVATISNAMGSEGSATSVATGTTTITATDAGSGINDSTTLTVTPAVLVSLAVTPTNPSIALGTGQAFVAMGTYTDASVQDLTSSVTWSSSDTGVATISNAMGSEGSATSVATGMTTMTATDAGSGINDSTTLTVTAAALVSIGVTPVGVSVAVGKTRAFTATGTYTDASQQDITAQVTWSSSASAAATVSNALASEGEATAVSLGSTTITATDPGTGVFGSTSLTVVQDITYRSSNSAGFGTGVVSVTVTTPVGTASGDLMLAAVAFRPDTAVVTPPSGWTLIRRTDAGVGNTNSMATYHRTAGASEPVDYTWSLSSSTGAVGAMASFYGVDTSSPIDAEDGQDTALGLVHTTPAVTTTVAGTMLVSFHALSSSVGWTPPPGMVEVEEVVSVPGTSAAGISMEMNYALQPAIGSSGTKAATADTHDDTGNAHLVALSPGS